MYLRRTGVEQGDQLEDYHHSLDEQRQGPEVKSKVDRREGTVGE